MVLPQVLNDPPRVQCLVLGSEQLNIDDVRVIIEEDDEVELCVWGSNGEWSTEIEVDQVQHICHMRSLRWRVAFARVFGHDARFALREWLGMVNAYAGCD